ncbi:MAG: transcription elongation factor GreB [Pseudomonadota bacterium]|nr:MAG: transcription elongation factor GreB [Pseudomonadota bacterium]
MAMRSPKNCRHASTATCQTTSRPRVFRISRRGVRQLENERVTLKGEHSIDIRSRMASIERDLRYLQERLRRARPLPMPTSPETVAFGVSVRLRDETGATYRFTLVGEDETDLARDRVSWASPIAKLLTGCEVGDQVVWSRGDTDTTLEIVEISA